ncbi:MAG: hypothetical protein ACK5ZI_11650 [bacterium]
MLKAIANIMSRVAPLRGMQSVSPSPAASRAPHGGGSRGGRRLVVAKFDSAKTTPENRKHWANADGLSPNAAINPEVRRVLRNRARYEVANNSYAKGIVLTLANDTIGTGPRLLGQSCDGRFERRFHPGIRGCQTLFGSNDTRIRFGVCEQRGIFGSSWLPSAPPGGVSLGGIAQCHPLFGAPAHDFKILGNLDGTCRPDARQRVPNLVGKARDGSKQGRVECGS